MARPNLYLSRDADYDWLACFEFGRTDVLMFGFATAHEGEEAMHAWRHVIEAGDPMGHFGLGYTLLELGDLHGAYKHLRAYTEIAKYSPWAWNYLGRAAEALGDHIEARRHYERAISLEELQGEPTDADERLAGLGGRG